MRNKLLFLCTAMLTCLLLCIAAHATTVVFVDNTEGKDTNSGIIDTAPLKTLGKAYEKLREAGGGTLVVSGSVTIPTNGFAPSATDGCITYTSVFGDTDYREKGAALQIYGNFAASGTTVFDNIDFNLYKSGAVFSGRHHDLSFGAGVSCICKSTSDSFIYPCIVGGWNLPDAAHADSTADYTLTVEGGTWHTLIGGNRRAAVSHAFGTLTGDRIIRITGGNFIGGMVALTGDEYSAGRVAAEITGGSFSVPVYLFRPLYNLPSGASTAGKHTTQITLRITGGSFSNIISADGKIRLENTVPNESRAALYVLGGSFTDDVSFCNRGMLGTFVLRCSKALESFIREHTDRALPITVDTAPVTDSNTVVQVSDMQAWVADPYAIRKDDKYYFVFPNSITVNDEKVAGLRVAESSEILFSNLNYNSKPVWNATMTDREDCKYQYWAPELHYFDAATVGTADAGWYIYFTADDGDNENHRMFVLRADNPEDPTGSYSLMGKLATDGDFWAIDGTVLQYGKKLYFVWSGKPGTNTRVQNLYIQPMQNPYTLEATSATCISTPSLSFELLNGKINEGPQALILNDTVHILYSTNGSSTEHYRLGMLTLTGSDPMRADAWTKSTEPRLTSDPTASMWGTGHASFVQNHHDGTWWIYYHANDVWVEDDWSSGTSTWWAGRKTFIQPFTLGTEVIGGKNCTVPVFGTPLSKDITRPLTVASPDYCTDAHLTKKGELICRICDTRISLPSDLRYGDLNADDCVNLTDALLLLRKVLNGNADTALTDVLRMLRYISTGK